MRLWNLSIFLLIFTLCIIACSGPASNYTEKNNDSSAQSNLDTLLAKELGADDYGMKSYVMAFLKAGPNRDLDSAKAIELQRAHLDNITRLAEEGVLVLAGPFLDNGELRGIYIFDVSSIEEARRLTATDPAIQAGSLTMELKPWYGSAALMKLNEIHEKISRISI
jgi:uncharacterized protein YciI